MENEMRKTEDGKMYWNGEGAYEAEYQRLYDELVPASGRSNSFQGEVMRAVSRMYYEYYNNGNCNACQEIPSKPYWELDDEDDMEYEFVVSEFYQGFIDLIDCYLYRRRNDEGVDLIKKIENMITTCSFGEVQLNQKYERLMDIVLYELSNDENRDEIPEWYKN
jgi:hypothetical protein